MTTLLDYLATFLMMTLGLVLRLSLAIVVLAAILLPVVGAIEAGPRLAALWRRLRGMAVVEGLPWRARPYYAAGHTWVRRRWSRGLAVGIDALAARLLPRLSAVELPAPGRFVHRGDVVAELSWESRRAVLAAPVEGTVVSVNPALAEDPSLALRDPYGRGWLYVVAPTAAWERGLRHGLVAREWFALESRRLARSLEDGLGLAAADGGHLVEPAPALLDEERWRTLTRSFLRAA